MRVLFLGSNGRVGQLLRARWTRNDVTPVWHARTFADVTFDILAETDALQAAMSSCDVAVNLAGATHHGPSNIGTANSALAKTILDHANGTPVILMSSAAVYGTSSGDLSEDTPPTPASDYGRDKAQMEAVAQAHFAKSTILRLGNVAGADALLGVERDRYILDRFADGTYPCRSYIGPRQLAETLADLILKHDNLPQVLNVAAQCAVSMGDLLDAAGKPWDAQPAGPNAIAKVELNTSLLETVCPLPAGASDAQTIVDDWRSVKAAS